MRRTAIFTSGRPSSFVGFSRSASCRCGPKAACLSTVYEAASADSD